MRTSYIRPTYYRPYHPYVPIIYHRPFIHYYYGWYFFPHPIIMPYMPYYISTYYHYYPHPILWNTVPVFSLYLNPFYVGALPMAVIIPGSSNTFITGTNYPGQQPLPPEATTPLLLDKETTTPKIYHKYYPKDLYVNGANGVNLSKIVLFCKICIDFIEILK